MCFSWLKYSILQDHLHAVTKSPTCLVLLHHTWEVILESTILSQRHLSGPTDLHEFLAGAVRLAAQGHDLSLLQWQVLLGAPAIAVGGAHVVLVVPMWCLHGAGSVMIAQFIYIYSGCLCIKGRILPNVKKPEDTSMIRLFTNQKDSCYLAQQIQRKGQNFVLAPRGVLF